MSFYSEAAASAHAVLVELGADATLVSKTGVVYDVATARATAATTRSRTVRAVVFDYPQRYIDGTLIRQSDKQCYMSTVGAGLPKIGDAVVWGGVTHQVVNVKPLAPALTAVLFDLQLRTSP